MAWFRGPTLLEDNGENVEIWRQKDKHFLRLYDVEKPGFYSCTALNTHGEISHNFKLALKKRKNWCCMYMWFELRFPFFPSLVLLEKFVPNESYAVMKKIINEIRPSNFPHRTHDISWQNRNYLISECNIFARCRHTNMYKKCIISSLTNEKNYFYATYLTYLSFSSMLNKAPNVNIHLENCAIIYHI